MASQTSYLVEQVGEMARIWLLAKLNHAYLETTVEGTRTKDRLGEAYT